MAQLAVQGGETAEVGRIQAVLHELLREFGRQRSRVTVTPGAARPGPVRVMMPPGPGRTPCGDARAAAWGTGALQRRGLLGLSTVTCEAAQVTPESPRSWLGP